MAVALVATSWLVSKSCAPLTASVESAATDPAATFVTRVPSAPASVSVSRAAVS